MPLAIKHLTAEEGASQQDTQDFLRLQQKKTRNQCAHLAIVRVAHRRVIHILGILEPPAARGGCSLRCQSLLEELTRHLIRLGHPVGRGLSIFLLLERRAHRIVAPLGAHGVHAMNHLIEGVPPRGFRRARMLTQGDCMRQLGRTPGLHAAKHGCTWPASSPKPKRNLWTNKFLRSTRVEIAPDATS